MPDLTAIALDIDGTLLDSQGRLSDANRSALHRCVQRGILLYTATARPPRLVLDPAEAAGLSFLRERGVFYSGALAIDRSVGYTRHRPVPAGLVSEITALLTAVAPDLQIALQGEDIYHSFRLPMNDAALAGWGFSREELLPFSEACRRACSKICVLCGERHLGDVYDDLVRQHGDRLNIFLTDDGRWLQLVSKEASKERALSELLALRGISPDRVAVFGDDAPDAGMFRAFGYSIAMANASEALKEVATWVTLSNDADGVAFALDLYLGL